MKKIYNKPVIEVETFVTEEIMEGFNPENMLSYNPVTGYGYQDAYINFQGNNPANTLTSIDYKDFILP